MDELTEYLSPPMSERPGTLPLVTIVVPVYNGEQYLRACLDSLLAQTYGRCEILVMDDASTDGTAAIVQSYGDRISSIRQPANLGQFGNVSEGVLRAQGEFIAVYHADDIYAAEIVEHEVSFLLRFPDAGAVFCLDLFINADGQEYGRVVLPSDVRSDQPMSYDRILNALLTYKNTFLITPSSMVRGDLYKRMMPFRGDEFGIASDLDMWVRISRESPIGIIQDYLMSYRHGHGNLSQRHYHLRTETENHFRIMDALVERDHQRITRRALAAHEAHRAEDLIMVAINCYILDRRREMQQRLRATRIWRMLGSPAVQRSRLLVLYAILRVLARLPRSRHIADRFYRRWHVKSYSA